MSNTIWEQIATDIHTVLDDESVEMLAGRSSLNKHAQTRRVIWYPLPSPISTVKQVGGKSQTISGKPNMVREACTLEYTLQACVYAEDDETAEALAAYIVSAAHKRFDARCRPTNWVWVTEQADVASGVTKRQPKIALTIVVDCPIDDEIAKLTPIRGVHLTQTLRTPISG
jgi:hypothetical protein